VLIVVSVPPISRTGLRTRCPDVELNTLERLWPVVARTTSGQGGSPVSLENRAVLDSLRIVGKQEVGHPESARTYQLPTGV
jgi:hypothetical protein